MSIILNIETAVAAASVCLARNEEIIKFTINPEPKDSAAWLHVAIQSIIADSNLSFSSIDAIAVSSGPGSYTGLRVGMATAKGLGYALNKPLITIDTLELMASSISAISADFFCPMIDARRMEVFMSIFDQSLNKLIPSTNKILEAHSFDEWLEKGTICFSGNGSVKFQPLIAHPNAIFSTQETTARHMVPISNSKFIRSDFASLAYAEPFYGKEFHSTIKES